MLGRTLLPNGATGCVLGYGGNWSVAAGVAEAILPGLNSAGAHLELHVGVKAPVPATLRTAGADARLRWWQPQRRHLGSLMESLREKDSIEGALMDMSGLVLPSNAAGFLKNVSSEVLGNIFQTHGEQQDELLWSRFAEVLVAQCHRARLKNNADIPGLFAAAAKRLDDAAGPSPDAAMTALRTHLREARPLEMRGPVGCLGCSAQDLHPHPIDCPERARMTGALRGGFGCETSTTSMEEPELVTDDDYTNREKDQEVRAKLGPLQNFFDYQHPNCRGPCNKRKTCKRFPCCMFCHSEEHDCPPRNGDQRSRDSRQVRTTKDQKSRDLQSAAKALRELCEDLNFNSDDIFEVVNRLGSMCKEMKQRNITTQYQGRKPWKWLSGRLAYLSEVEDQTWMLWAINEEIQGIQTAEQSSWCSRWPDVETLHRCLWQIFMKLEAKCRVVLLLDRRDFAAKLRGFLRSHEEPNEALVRHWRQHKARRNTLHRFQKLRCIFRGKRSTLEVSMFMFPGRRSTLDVSCCMFFANRIVWGASSGDIVQIVWQAWISVTVSFCVAGAAFGADPSCVACHIAWQAQYLVQLQRTSVDLTLSTLYPTPSTPSTLSTLSTLYTAHCALHTPHLTLYTPHSRLYTPCSTLYTPHSTLYTPHSTLYTPLHTPHSTLYPHGRGLLVDAGQGFGEMAGNVTKVVLPQHQMKVIKHKQKMATVGQVDGYLKEAASATTWIDGVLSQACSEKLGIPVKIWWKSQHDVWTRHTCAPAFDSQRVAKIAKGEKPVVLALESKHYQWVQPPAGANVPKQLLTETVPPHYKVLAGAALRGTGASSTSSPSVHSMRSVLPLCAHDENKSPANARMSPPPGVKRSRLAAVRLLLSTTRALRTVVSARMSAHARVCPPDPEELNVIIASEGLSSLPCRQRADVILGAQKATQYGTVIVANFELLKVMPNLLSPWNTEGRPAAPYAPTGHVMPVASLMELEATPAGLRHVDTKAIPERVTMVVAAKDRPTPHNVDDAVLVKHAQVVSLCDPDHKMFVVEAICSLADMFVYNMGDGKPRFLVGTVRLAGDARIKEMPAAQHETGCRQT
eukprot:s410_g3.t1